MSKFVERERGRHPEKGRRTSESSIRIRISILKTKTRFSLFYKLKLNKNNVI
jgi:hypothetical protein